MPDLSVEATIQTDGLIFGLDEAGRGPWCGPVVAACVCWKSGQVPLSLAHQINDSKKLTLKKREALFPLILSCPTAIVGVGEASAAEIDSMNILQASFLAMQRALDSVRKQGYSPAFALIDGNRLPNWDLPSRCLVKGDALSLSIAAASIIAKVVRDRYMARLSQEYPAYHWDKNAGYGTPEHIAALQAYGITPHHRKSYAPIRKLLISKALAAEA